MFELSGIPSVTSGLITNLVEKSALFREHPDRCAVTVYRNDHTDQFSFLTAKYSFLTAAIGLKEKEPLFGPVTWNDHRLAQPAVANVGEKNPYGFVIREDILPEGMLRIPDTSHGSIPLDGARHIPEEEWQIYFNIRRLKNEKSDISMEPLRERFRSELVPSLELILKYDAERRRKDQQVLFGDLWQRERQARDQMQEVMRRIAMETDPHSVIPALEQIISQCVSEPHLGRAREIAFYLFDGRQFTRRADRGAILPPMIPLSDPPRDALSWVFKASKPALVLNGASHRWAELVKGLHAPLVQSGRLHADYSGISIVPLPDLTEPPRSTDYCAEPKGCLGVAVLLERGNGHEAAMTPAQHFLFCRLARVVSSYLITRLPLPGYPCWSAHPWRGDAVKISGLEDEEKIAKKFVEDLMPSGSTVTATRLKGGLSGARIFKLEVTDYQGRKEIDRVLKIDESASIAKEFENYYRFVHNKKIGVCARIDIARAKWWLSQSEIPADGTADDSTLVSHAAIIYMFVEDGELLQSWCRRKSSHIETVLKMIQERLAGWTVASTQKETTRQSLFEKPFSDISGWKKFRDLEQKNKALHKRMLAFLRQISDCINDQRLHQLYLIHGDLHCGNVFVLPHDGANAGRSVHDIALIDWGNVTETGHPLVDAALLLRDIVYRARWDNWQKRKPDERLKWMIEQLNSWRVPTDFHPSLGVCRLALANQLVRALTYAALSNDSPREDRMYEKAATDAMLMDLSALAKLALKEEKKKKLKPKKTRVRAGR